MTGGLVLELTPGTVALYAPIDHIGSTGLALPNFGTVFPETCVAWAELAVRWQLLGPSRFPVERQTFRLLRPAPPIPHAFEASSSCARL